MLPQQYEKITTAGVRRILQAALDTGPVAWVGNIAMTVRSDQAVETYPWLGNSPTLREFIGGRTPALIKESGFTVASRDFEGSITFESKDMRRDKLGLILTRINQLSQRVLDHPARLLSALIAAGESTLCYDGQYFFDTDHSDGASGTLSNKVGASASSPTAPTADEFGAAVIAAIQQMITFRDDVGEPINQSANSFLVMVPVPFLGAALKSVTALLGTGGQSATLPALAGYFNVRVVANPRLNWTTKFATFRTDEAAKPFILQEENVPDTVALGEGSEYEQLNRKCLFGVDWTGNVAPAWWQHAVLTTFS